jgi:hypothetical protein
MPMLADAVPPPFEVLKFHGAFDPEPRIATADAAAPEPSSRLVPHGLCFGA